MIRSSSVRAASTSRGLGVALLERRLEVVEGRLGALGEGDRLLDLEREGDLAVIGAAVVLDRDQVEEAGQLCGPPRLLLGGERRGGEAVDRLERLVARASERARSRRSRPRASEAKVSSARRRSAAPRWRSYSFASIGQ